MSNHTKIPEAELDVLKHLGVLRVIFDVGARADVDYLEMFPSAEFHLFEPNQDFFKELVEAVGNHPNVYLNNFGLGDVPGEFKYQSGVQAVETGEANPAGGGDRDVEIRRLDDYAKDIETIDFLKIDTEGFDFKVLLGGFQTLKRVKFIQYEHWNDTQEFYDLLEPRFKMMPIGYRNVLCANKLLLEKKRINSINQYIKRKKYAELA